MKMTQEEMGICVRCKKNKATINYTDSVLSYTHGFVEKICKECYNKIRDNNTWYQQGIQEGKQETLDKVEMYFAYSMLNKLIPNWKRFQDWLDRK